MERKFNEKTLALKEMIKMARKHCPQIVDVLHVELEREHMEIRMDNIRRVRLRIIKS